MAKINLNRLTKKYGKNVITGARYENVMSEIVSHNTDQISRTINRMTKTKIDSGLKKLDRVAYEQRKFILPDISDVLPKRSVMIRKGAEKGKIITKTLRDRLTGDLTSVLEEEPNYLIKTGKNAGSIRPEVIKKMRGKITETFKEYTKVNPKYGVPSNVKTIATTEVRSAINNIKATYMDKLIEKNRNDITVKKRWRHNRGLVITPRLGHQQKNMSVVDWDKPFKLRRYRIGSGGKPMFLGWITMRYPHDPEAEAGDIIGCECDFDILIFRKRG